MPKTKIRKNRIKELRERSRLTLQEVATLANLDFTTVSKHEGMKRSLDQSDVNAYSQIFKVTSVELFVDPKEFMKSKES